MSDQTAPSPATVQRSICKLESRYRRPLACIGPQLSLACHVTWDLLSLSVTLWDFNDYHFFFTPRLPSLFKLHVAGPPVLFYLHAFCSLPRTDPISPFLFSSSGGTFQNAIQRKKKKKKDLLHWRLLTVWTPLRISSTVRIKKENKTRNLWFEI